MTRVLCCPPGGPPALDELREECFGNSDAKQRSGPAGILFHDVVVSIYAYSIIEVPVTTAKEVDEGDADVDVSFSSAAAQFLSSLSTSMPSTTNSILASLFAQPSSAMNYMQVA